MRVFAWNDWNIGHIAAHGVVPAEAEYVVRRERRPFPEPVGGGKWYVAGKTAEGRWLQVVYVLLDPENVQPDSLSVADMIAFGEFGAQVALIIHARELTDDEKRRIRKRGSSK